MKLSPTKTIIVHKTTTILGWVWSSGSIHASPHRIATLSKCSPPTTVRGLRSFVGAYKVLVREIPQCSSLIAPLDDAGRQSQETLVWTEDTHAAFATAQRSHLQQNDHTATTFEKLHRGEFSNSPRVLTFLSILSRYQASLRHLAGSANVPSDFASRNASECNIPGCQICSLSAQKIQSSGMFQRLTSYQAAPGYHLPAGVHGPLLS